MTTEDKLLLVQDLCARLPYGVQVQHITTKISGTLHDIIAYPLYNKDGSIYDIDAVTDFFGECDYVYLEYFKPYLYPLSSMTKEQKNQLKEIWDTDMNKALDYTISGEERLSNLSQLFAAKKVINWFIKNHFDYNGLIDKDLAIDCTNLNIY